MDVFFKEHDRVEYIYCRENVWGFLFQGRFSSGPVYTDQYLFTALRRSTSRPKSLGLFPA